MGEINRTCDSLPPLQSDCKAQRDVKEKITIMKNKYLINRNIVLTFI